MADPATLTGVLGDTGFRGGTVAVVRFTLAAGLVRFSGGGLEPWDNPENMKNIHFESFY